MDQTSTETGNFFEEWNEERKLFQLDARKRPVSICVIGAAAASGKAAL